MYYFHWLPIGTDARARSAPWVTSSLVVLNVLFYAFVLASRADTGALYSLAFKAADPSVPTALASLFLHADPIHLLGNIFFLWLLGPPLEGRLGAVRYLIAYLACGWLANLAQAAAVLSQRPELASVPIVGASGAISGLMGLFLVRLHFARLRFVSIPWLLSRGVVTPASFALPAAVGIGIWLALTLVYHVVGIGAETAYVSHVAGAAFGVIFAAVMGLRREGRLERRIALGDRYAERGEWFAALGEYESYLRRVPDDPDALARAARLQRVTHQSTRSAERFRESIRQWLRRGEVRSACDTYDEMRRLLGGDVLLPPSEQLRVARAFEDMGRSSEASRAYEAYGKHYADRHAAALAMLKSAEIQRRALNNPGRARFIYEELSRRPLPSDLQQLLEERKRVTERQMKRLEHGVAS